MTLKFLRKSSSRIRFYSILILKTPNLSCEGLVLTNNNFIMKKLFLSGFIFIMISLGMSAQTGGPITLEKKGMRRSYIRDGKTLDPKQLGTLLSSDHASARTFRTARITGYTAYGFIAAGAVSAGFGLYNSIKAAQATNDGDLAASTDYSNKSTGDLLITAGCFVASIPFLLISNSQFRKSINLYNSSRKTGSLNRIDLNVGLTGNGAIVQLSF